MESINAYGLSLELPDGWFGRIYQRDSGAGEITKPIIHASNAPLSSIEDDDTLAGTMNSMGSRGVTIAIFELEPLPGFSDPAMGFGDVSGGASLRPEDSRNIQGVPSNFLSFVRRIRSSGRYFQVRVVFGADRAPVDLYSEVNGLLASFR